MMVLLEGLMATPALLRITYYHFTISPDSR